MQNPDTLGKSRPKWENCHKDGIFESCSFKIQNNNFSPSARPTWARFVRPPGLATMNQANIICANCETHLFILWWKGDWTGTSMGFRIHKQTHTHERGGGGGGTVGSFSLFVSYHVSYTIFSVLKTIRGCKAGLMCHFWFKIKSVKLKVALIRRDICLQFIKVSSYVLVCYCVRNSVCGCVGENVTWHI